MCPHEASADTLRYGLSLRTRLALTLFGIGSANDRILLIHGAGDFHRGGHGLQEVSLGMAFF